ncbi:redoxin domain-containing protein [Pseudoduganella eburnea]|uniref:Redoxin domain-containing protein n=1 Tax=Massilia eburnea TaxID=1776165 RepID=A0A6L6QPF3_9BURK|nr:SCO family protein [Massilia eburnea]MTW13393.1 redoxin domain-containing protein [Massilia eburnea]
MIRRSLFALLLAAAGLAHAADKLKSGTFDPPRMAPQIAQKAADGQDFALDKFRGKVVVLEFGYTSCADVCPVSLALLKQARERLGPLAGKLQVVFVTVDPERDTGPKLKAYLEQFDPSFIGLTGSEAQMAAIRSAYGITATKKMVEGSKTAYTMGHSSYLYFIDPQGRLRALMPFGRPADDIVHDVTLLAQGK